MKAFRKAIYLFAALLTTGCVYDNSPEQCRDESKEGIFLSLDLRSVAPTRSNPTGGEDGDGREPGLLNEDAISSLSLFFYKSETGVNDEASTPVFYYLHVPSVTAQSLYKMHLKDFGDESQIQGARVLVAANLPEIPKEERKTLGQVRTTLVENAWTPGSSRFDIPGCRKFVMATADEKAPYDGKVVTAGHKGDENDPYLAQVEIERVAARIDLMFDQANLEDKEHGLMYSISEPDAYGDAGIVYITHAVPMNLMEKPSWLLKQVSPDFSAITYCGDEEKDASDKNTNYVVEPLSTTKNAELKGTAVSTAGWYFNPADAVATSITDLSNVATWELSKWISESTRLLECKDGHDKQLILAYTNENTQDKGLNSSKYLTGLMLRTVFVPTWIYSDAELSTRHAGTYGETFWRYSYTKKNMASTTQKALYFDNEEALRAYVGAHPQDPATASVQAYTGGVCYYNIWLRHSNSELGADENYEGSWPMEYGIVRNNIYRIGFSFSGPGRPQPDLRQPETVSPRIFVRKWNIRRMNEIIAD